MAIYAVYDALVTQAPDRTQALSRRFVSRLFITDVPAGTDEESVRTALVRGGHRLEPLPLESDRPSVDYAWRENLLWGRTVVRTEETSLDVAWNQCVVCNLKHAPDAVSGDWLRREIRPVRTVPWSELSSLLPDDLDRA